jgi:hypothetical protein
MTPAALSVSVPVSMSKMNLLSVGVTETTMGKEMRTISRVKHHMVVKLKFERGYCCLVTDPRVSFL